MYIEIVDEIVFTYEELYIPKNVTERGSSLIVLACHITHLHETMTDSV